MKSGRAGLFGAVLMVALPVLAVLSVRTGPTGLTDLSAVLQGGAAALGLGEPLDGTAQAIVELRLWRALVAAGVGAALALAGALVQGVFRNPLAAPSIIGVTAGASVGASLAIVLLAGFGGAMFHGMVSVQDIGPATFVVPLFGFVGALAVVLFVTMLASPGGRLSAPTLLLAGIAVNTCLSGVLALISWWTLREFEVSRALLAWNFGTFDDRSAWHAATVWAGLGVAALVIPFVARELDLMQAGEEDARGLGVATLRVRILAIVAAALAASAAVAVAGQIGFVGLIVPHLVRLAASRRHTLLLPLSMLAGAVFLLGLDLLQYGLLGDHVLQPGVAMSLVGGPFFLVLLTFNRRELQTW